MARKRHSIEVSVRNWVAGMTRFLGRPPGPIVTENYRQSLKKRRGESSASSG